MSLVRQYRNSWALKADPEWLVEARKRHGIPTRSHPILSQPCKNGQPFVAADGSCLRCGADQGVHGSACDYDARTLSKPKPHDETRGRE